MIIYHAHAAQELLLACCSTLITHCAIMLFAILETFILLSISLLLCIYII